MNNFEKFTKNQGGYVMKKIIFFIATLALFACNETAILPDVPAPRIVTLKVLPSTPSVGDKITVEFEAVNATSTYNNIGAPSTSKWSYEMVVSNKVTISTVAVNELGIKDEMSLDVIPKAITAADTIYGAWILTDRYISLDGVNYKKQTPSEDKFVNMQYVFYSNGKYEVYLYPYNVSDLVGSGVGCTWSVEQGRIFKLGEEKFNFFLTANELTLFSKTEGEDLITGKKFPVWNKILFTKKK